MPDKPNLEEQLISQAVERSVSKELDEVEKIDIDVQTDITKIFQGQVDGVSLAGQGLVIQEHNLRVQEIKLQTDNIAINPLNALFGQIKLNEPVNAIAHIVLTEADINRALTSKFIFSLVKSLELNVDGEIVSFEPQQTQVILAGDGKIEISGKVLLKEKENTRPLGYHAIVYPRTQSQPPRLKSFQCTEEEGVSIEFIVAAMQKVKELLNLPYIEWDDIAFNIKEMEVQKGILKVVVNAHLRQIPSL